MLRVLSLCFRGMSVLEAHFPGERGGIHWAPSRASVGSQALFGHRKWRERQEGATGQGEGAGPRGRGGARVHRRRRGPHLQVKTSVRSLQVLHLTKQHQWNLQLHCQTLVYWCVL